MILFSLMSVNNLSSNCFLLNDLQSFDIKSVDAVLIRLLFVISEFN